MLSFVMLEKVIDAGRTAEDYVWAEVAKAIDAEGKYIRFESAEAMAAHFGVSLDDDADEA